MTRQLRHSPVPMGRADRPTRGLFRRVKRISPGDRDSLAERGGFEPPVPRGLLWAEFGPSLADYSARQKASVLERICSPGIRLCFGSLRFASFARLKADARRRRTSDQSFGFKSERLYGVIGRNFCPAPSLQPRQTAAARAMENSVDAWNVHHPSRGDLST
jgi:hypothetical protein